jgi:hypothetical protein
MSNQGEYTRVYLLSGRVAHLLAPSTSPNSPAATALCGVTNWPGYFRGTGAWGEREQARDMPLCQNCKRMHGSLRLAGQATADE